MGASQSSAMQTVIPIAVAVVAMIALYFLFIKKGGSSPIVDWIKKAGGYLGTFLSDPVGIIERGFSDIIPVPSVSSITGNIPGGGVIPNIPGVGGGSGIPNIPGNITGGASSVVNNVNPSNWHL